MSVATLRNLIRIWRTHPVTRGRILDSIARFTVWQVTSRLHTGKLIVPFVEPTVLIATRGQTGTTGNIYFGLAEMHDMAFALHYLRRNDTFVDVGANVGSYSILASGVVGARTIAFEPISDTARKMYEQLRINNILDKVEVREMALGPTVGEVRFLDTLDTVNRVVTERESASSSRIVRQSTLDRELLGVSPALIKLDVEGYEYAVLQGAAEVLHDTVLNAVILELHGGSATYGVDPAALEALLGTAGFRPYSYDSTKRELTSVTISQAHTHGLSDNVLMIRDIDEARRRVLSAPSFSVLGRTF